MAQRVDAPDGRALAVYEEGDPNGIAVIVHHGTPDSGLLYRMWVALAREQGIRLEHEADRPVLLLHGADDRFVPIAHGRWLAGRVPAVEPGLTGDEDGHLTLIALRVREVHEWLLAHI